ncbi:MAG TPA: DUF2085 domain-containing protein [Vicinamibacterales bacterium]
MTEKRRLICASLALATAAWTVAIVAGPWLSTVTGMVGGWLYAAGSLVCHQRPERSFHLGAAQLPVCARCLGLYAGGAVGLLAWTIGARRRSPWPARQATLALAMTGAPTAITVVTASVGLGDPSNLWRAGLAAPLGIASGLVVGAVVTDHLK